MSLSSRPFATLALAVLVGFSAPSVTAGQVQAVKDGWLVMKVHSEMLDEDLLNGSDIDVDVKGGVVTLQGTVPSQAGRARALEVARKNDGVKSVVDKLTIAAPRAGRVEGRADRAADTAERKAERAADKAERKAERAADGTANTANKTGRAIDDGWIKSKIYAQYLADWGTILDDSDIDIDVKDNAVTLSGTVKSAEAKTRAVAVAKATDGVKSVRDALRIAAK
jgi:hyperosmotically inducible periplasmic protein